MLYSMTDPVLLKYFVGEARLRVAVAQILGQFGYLRRVTGQRKGRTFEMMNIEAKFLHECATFGIPKGTREALREHLFT